MFRVIMLLLMGGIVIAAIVGGKSSTHSADPIVSASVDPGWARQLESLRDEAIQSIGWIAGNAKGHKAWEEARPYFDKGGTYYDFFVRLAVPGKTSEVDAYHNVHLYNEWVDIGAKAKYDYSEMVDRTRRLLDINQRDRPAP